MNNLTRKQIVHLFRDKCKPYFSNKHIRLSNKDAASHVSSVENKTITKSNFETVTIFINYSKDTTKRLSVKYCGESDATSPV